MSDQNTRFESWQVCSNSAIRRATRQLGQLFDEVLAPSGLKGTQHTLLTQIHMSGNPSLRFLADSMVMDLSALGHTLKPLIRDGLVELVPDTKDRRVKRVMLTASGLAKWEEAHRLWQDARQRFDQNFGPEAAQELRNALNLISSDTFADNFRQ